jgi:hypothetical protein
MKVYLGGVEYEICDHALKRMIRRGITRADIQACLDNHQVSFTPKEGYSLYMADHPSGKRLQVVLNTDTKEIVSVVWLD